MREHLLRESVRWGFVVIMELVLCMPATAEVPLLQISADPFSNRGAQHRTQVEPDTFSFGNTIVSAFQTGRVAGGGSAGIGWATSADGGNTWTHGFLPGITANTQPAGRYKSVSDPSVAYDSAHDTWLIVSLGIRRGSTIKTDVLVSLSSDGAQTWSPPTAIRQGVFPDKTWIVCDNGVASPYRGSCYFQYDEVTKSDQVRMQVTTDGGLTWSRSRLPKGSLIGLGGQPVVRPDGIVVVPYLALNGELRAFLSRDGGKRWTAGVTIARLLVRPVNGNLRQVPVPSAEVDGAGTVYVVWYDCRYRIACATNDILMSSSTDGKNWDTPSRIPIDDATSQVDHFIPGIGVDPASSGAAARLGLTYFYYAKTPCTFASCRLKIGFVSSVNGGLTWSEPTTITGPMRLRWLPDTTQGRMVGDYISTSVLPGGNAFPVVPVASRKTADGYNQSMYVPIGGLPITGGNRPTDFGFIGNVQGN